MNHLSIGWSLLWIFLTMSAVTLVSQLFFWFVRKCNRQPEQVRIEDQDLLSVFGHDSRQERR